MSNPAAVSATPQMALGHLATALSLQLHRCRTAFLKRGRPLTLEERLDALTRLEQAVHERRMEIAAAISADFNGRAYEETLAVEVFGVLDEIRYTRKHLKSWMRPRRAKTNWLFWPSRSRILYQPLGVIGIMGAFNYPVYLTLSPLVGAVAAGNHVMVKPSELTPRTGRLLADIVGKLFAEEYVTVVTGDGEVSKAFACQPFDHLLFTGSTRVGHEIMRQAAAHLTPVTLELGGKCPAIIDRQSSLQKAVDHICHAKFLNAGQTCLAPDHVWVPAELREEFLQLARSSIQRYYPQLVANPDYTRIISSREHARLEGWLDEARNRGAKVEVVNPKREICDADNRVFAPTLVWNCPDDTPLMEREVFGPILPVRSYENLDDVIGQVNEGPRPLALYYFCNDRQRVEDLLQRTISGGVTINGCIYHIAQHSLPFGGIGDSGMGHYHGFDGFETFSKKKAVFQVSRMTNLALLRPPFGPAIEWIIGILLGRRVQRESLPPRNERLPR